MTKVFMFLLLALPAWGAIGNFATSASDVVLLGGSTQVRWTHTAGAPDSDIVVVCTDLHGWPTDPVHVSNVTVDGNSARLQIEEADDDTENAYVSMWYYDGSLSGTFTITATFNKKTTFTMTYHQCAAITFTGGDLSSGFEDFTAVDTFGIPSITGLSCTSGALGIDVYQTSSISGYYSPIGTQVVNSSFDYERLLSQYVENTNGNDLTWNGPEVNHFGVGGCIAPITDKPRRRDTKDRNRLTYIIEISI